MSDLLLAGRELIENLNLFACPICGNKMLTDDRKSIYCLNRHSFDLAQSGYVNLLLKRVKTDYDKELFAARSIICASGFFDPVLLQIKKRIEREIASQSIDKINILDVGCGEGSLLARLNDSLSGEKDFVVRSVGIDIAKEGIRQAAKKYSRIVWCVANLARAPFTTGQFQVLLNIFSPSNYLEFSRMMSVDGLLIKVIPCDNYLQELRRVFYDSEDKQFYSNKQTVELFSDSFAVLETRQMNYQVPVKKEHIEHLIKMTPLSWHVAAGKIKKVLDSPPNSITVDVTMLVGKKLICRDNINPH